MNASEIQIRSDQLASREALKRTFQNRIRLSESHFALLIHSTLNKRDDQFHGYWRAGQTYRQGDVVYHQGALWEMTGAQEICGEADKAPGSGDDWTSVLRQLEDRVDGLEANLAQLCQDFQDFQQLMQQRQQQIDLQLTVLTVVFGTTVFLWVCDYFYHIWVGAS